MTEREMCVSEQQLSSKCSAGCVWLFDKDV